MVVLRARSVGAPRALVQASLRRRRINFVLALSQQRVELSFAFSRRHLDFTPALALQWRFVPTRVIKTVEINRRVCFLYPFSPCSHSYRRTYQQLHLLLSGYEANTTPEQTDTTVLYQNKI